MYGDPASIIGDVPLPGGSTSSGYREVLLCVGALFRHATCCARWPARCLAEVGLIAATNPVESLTDWSEHGWV
jgi:hypothetical protein